MNMEVSGTSVTIMSVIQSASMNGHIDRTTLLTGTSPMAQPR
jgi:hypothetical protein